MKVSGNMTTEMYVACYGYNYEGETVIGVFDSLDKAKAKGLSYPHGDYWTVYKAGVNEDAVEPVEVTVQRKLV